MRESTPPPAVRARKRLARDERLRQLLDTAWAIVREDGTEALTLGRLAGRAGVTKPLVYGHFGTRSGLLAMLYGEFDKRQIELMEQALRSSEPTLSARAGVIAKTYVQCVLAQGREIPGVIAALHGSRELEAVRSVGEAEFMSRCRDALAPFASPAAIPAAGLRAVLGAAEALSYAAVNGKVTADEAQKELQEVITALVTRARARAVP